MKTILKLSILLLLLAIFKSESIATALRRHGNHDHNQYGYYYDSISSRIQEQKQQSLNQGFNQGQRSPPSPSQLDNYEEEEREGDSQQVKRGTDQEQHSDQEPEVVTPKGTFVGVKEIVNGKELYAFYGVPFANPTVRFRRAEIRDKMEKPLRTQEKPPACSQSLVDNVAFKNFSGEEMWFPTTGISEDCLFLNIWVSKSVFLKRNEEGNEKASVLFWIHGGGFFSGSSSLEIYDGGALAVTEDIIVVSAQYRMGVFGFLNFGIEDCPGNIALTDQTLAMQWTKENIQAFGGDPDSITAAGQSAGSASVGLHLMSPLSKPYFKRGIMMSGVPDETYVYNPPDVVQARSFKFAAAVGCKQTDPKDVVECLRTVDADTLNELQWTQRTQLNEYPFTATIDNYFIMEEPSKSIKTGKEAEVMISTAKDEGSFTLLYYFVGLLHNINAVEIPYDDFVKMMKYIFYYGYMYSEAETEAIISEYTNWENVEDGLKNLQSISDAISDMKYVCNQRNWAGDWAKRGLPVYYYHFTERLSSNPWGKWMGVMHGDDLFLFFGAALRDESYTLAEREMTLNFMRMVGNFVKTGVPSQKWERYSNENPVYLDVNATRISDASTPHHFGPRAAKCLFWNKILPLIKKSEGEGCGGNLLDCSSPPSASPSSTSTNASCNCTKNEEGIDSLLDEDNSQEISAV